MRKAKLVREITVIDPDTNGEVNLTVYKHENGGMFAMDSSFLDQCTDEDSYPVNGIKAQKIDKIKATISRWGETSCCELELDHSPCLNSIGNGKDNICELVEQFNVDGVEATTYYDEITIADNHYTYEELSDEVIDEIVEIMENYEADMLDDNNQNTNKIQIKMKKEMKKEQNLQEPLSGSCFWGHKWTKWEQYIATMVLKTDMKTEYERLRQRRTCLRCGKMELESL